ncbi:MAG TPA: ATP-binding protein, partial [Solirubrobacteraceae bacterium]
MARRPPYPLSAIVGQEDLVEALLVCAVSPAVGGVLVRGERGTAKSTAVRALAPILAEISVSGFAPLIELPLGATLDRLVGTLDLRAALAGEHRVEQGLLGRADGGLLYVDEVNLLPDHLADALLDAAASGVVTIERDGVSVAADARFLLVGTMNPEEGELRPQLLDRFGLGVEITGPRDPATRARIVRRRMDFDAAPDAFAAAWAARERALSDRVAAARRLVRAVSITDRDLLRITAVCAELDLDGIRGDLVCAHAACALAALDGLTDVAGDHIDRAAHLALRHRLRRDPLDPSPAGGRDPAIDDALDRTADASTESQPPPGDDPQPQARPPSPTPPPQWLPDPDLAADREPPPRVQPTDQPGPAPPRQQPADDQPAPPPRPTQPAPLPSRLPTDALALGPSRVPAGRLAMLDSRPALAGEEIAVRPSLIAGLRGDPRPHTAILGGRRLAVLCLIVDTSGSMAAHRRLARVKGALEAAIR